ncbi:MAG: hypothetical protein KGI60_02355, partial [Patescibacteria group bacterium]|nr:hypothetical protein [Patescibacteria group bacterium]
MITFLIKLFRTLSHTERLVVYGSALILFVAAGLLGILLFNAATVETPAPSPMYAEGVIGQPITLNPVIAGANDPDHDLIRLTFADLVTLSESVKTNDSGKTWDVVLKNNLRWSDGKPLTADDVIFTLDTIQNPDSRSPLALAWQGVVANRISEREVEFSLHAPYVFFPDNLQDLFVIPQHIWGTIPVANFPLSEYNLQPVGDGPYQYSSIEKRADGFITDYHLSANPSFPGPQPFLNEFTVTFYQSQSDLIDAFNTGKIDGFGGIAPQSLGDLKLPHTVLEKNVPEYYAVFFNKTTPGLDDQKVIQALTLAADKNTIVQTVFDGHAIVVNEPVLPTIDGYDNSADPGNAFSADDASALLDKAGWKLNDTTGIREKKLAKQTDVTPLEFSLVVPDVKFMTDTAAILQQEWKAVGVKLDLIVLNPTDIMNEIIKTRNYQMILFGNVLKQNPDLFSFWHSSEKFYP